MSVRTIPEDVLAFRRLLGAHVRAVLREHGLSVTDAAQIAGVSLPTMTRRLSGRTVFKIPELFALAEHLGIPLTGLIPEPLLVG